ncbi:MAG: hypothetical protein VW448_06160 [Gammaproteobacteria bacterium]
MAADDGKDFDSLSEKEQLEYYGKAYKDYLDRDVRALGGSMRKNYAMGSDDEQRLKDMLKDIEAGDIMEDIVDPEDYDDMGGIKSLDRGAPSIKLASETPIEEFGLELDSVYQEFLDAVRRGEFDGSFEDFAIRYFTAKKRNQEDRQMAMGGGRMQYAGGTKELGMFDEVIEKRYPTPVAARRAGDLEDAARNRDIEKVKTHSKPKPFKMDSDKIKELIEKRKKEKTKRAKGGIAGVL